MKEMKGMLPLPALTPQGTAEALFRRNDRTARYGLTLTPAQLTRLFRDAAEEAAARYCLAPLAREVLCHCAGETAARIAALWDASALAGLFP